ncbi:MAG: hypothetical protein QMC93_02430 [Patescibacteria group bacterium]|nr:hypothetical protein [Patescibacteria group bacterium]
MAKKKIYLTPLIFGIFLLIFIFLGLLPQIKNLKKSSEDFVFQKNTLNLIESQIGNFQDFQENYSFYQLTLEKIKESFVDLEAPVNFIEFLERESKDSNVEIKISSSVSSPIKSDFWQELGFQILIGGAFSNCLRFLERLERGPYLVEISQLNIQRIEERTPQRDLEGLLKGDVIFSSEFKVFSQR